MRAQDGLWVRAACSGSQNTAGTARRVKGWCRERNAGSCAMALPAEGDRRTCHQAGGTDLAPHLARGSISVPLEEPRDVEGLTGPRQPECSCSQHGLLPQGGDSGKGTPRQALLKALHPELSSGIFLSKLCNLLSSACHAHPIPTTHPRQGIPMGTAHCCHLPKTLKCLVLVRALLVEMSSGSCSAPSGELPGVPLGSHSQKGCTQN